MNENNHGFVPRMRHFFIHREVARIRVSGESFANMAALRAAVNARYGMFGVTPLSDPEFSLLLSLLARGPL